MASPVVATYSIAACDLDAGQWGVATQSKFLAVGSVVPWAEPQIGAVATQAYANPRYGPDGLALLRSGSTAEEAVASLTTADEGRDQRQLGIVDAVGGSATFTGSECYDWAGGLNGPCYAAQGNILVGAETVQALASTFEATTARPLAERVMFAVSYLAIAMLTYLLGRQMRESQALAERRSAEIADLAEVNELIIRRMRTGVLLVDGEGRIRLANEAAQSLLGEHDDARNLALAAPELARRMRAWLADGPANDAPLRLGAEASEVLPRFVRLRPQSENVLVFLDDTALVSRRAESMTLATLGRFSASLAHEIRNTLAAISYATQLLEESTEMSEGDRRLLQIIHQQCLRTNGIVESLLGIARRERASVEHMDLLAFVRRFVEDYRQVLQPEAGTLQVAGSAPVPLSGAEWGLPAALSTTFSDAGREPTTEGVKVTLTVHDAPAASVAGESGQFVVVA